MQLLANDLNDRALEDRVQGRLQAFLDRFLARRLGPLLEGAGGIDDEALCAGDAPARGLLFRLREEMGAVEAKAAKAQLPALSPQ